jgi:hypothetical protein
MRSFKRLCRFWERVILSIIQTLGSAGRFAANPDPYASNLVMAFSGSIDHGVTNVANLINPSGSNFPRWRNTAGVTSSFSATKKFYNNAFELGTRTISDSWILVDNPYLQAFSNADFTLETWVYIPTFTGLTQFAPWAHYTGGSNSGFQCFICGDSFGDVAARRGVYFVGGAGAELNIAYTCLSPNTWHHIAVVRNGSASNSLKIYVDGIDRTSYRNATGNPTWTFNGFFSIAAPSNETGWNTVKLQDHRVYQGVAKYTSNFTPPGAMFL